MVEIKKYFTLTLLVFLSGIYNGKITLNDAEFKQKDLEGKIRDLQFYYEPKNKKEKEEINGVLMQSNSLLEYRDKIIDAFKNGTFLSEHFKKKSDDAANNYVLKVVKKSNLCVRFIEEIKSMEEKINLSLFEEFFELSSPASYAKMLINIKNWNENKENVDEIKNRISDLEDRIKRMSEKEKKDKNADETLEIIEKTLDYNKDAQNYFHPASKVDKKKSEPRIEKGIADRVKLKNNKIA